MLNTSHILLYLILMTPCEINVINFIMLKEVKEVKLREIISPRYNCTILYQFNKSNNYSCILSVNYVPESARYFPVSWQPCEVSVFIILIADANLKARK